MKAPLGRKRTHPKVNCPDPLHVGSKVIAFGVYEGARRFRRYRCAPVGKRADEGHCFSLAIADLRPTRRAEPCPPCPDHPEGRVVRAGTYGRDDEHLRQRYRCHLPDGTSHRFTPPLPRAQVPADAEPCAHCSEHRGIHHGDPAVGRKHRFPPAVVAAGLEKLSSGLSYAEVSIWGLRQIGIDPSLPRRRSDPAQPPLVYDTDAAAYVEPIPLPDPLGKAETTFSEREARAAWRIAANWTEAFAPVVWEPVDARLRARATAERARLDALLDAGQQLDRPQVILVDDVPVYGKDNRTKRRDGGFYVLLVAEANWEQVKRPGPAFGEWRTRTVLRLARALPKSNSLAWGLVFAELGYTPDIVVADAGTGIGAGVKANLPAPRTLLVPSLWHVRRAILRAFDMEATPFLHRDTFAHVNLLERGSEVLMDPDRWDEWWRVLASVARSDGLPADKVKGMARQYGPPIRDFIPLLLANPGLRMSTGGLETIGRLEIGRVLTGRANLANIERTNNLLDLVVAREHGAFTKMAPLVARLTADAEARVAPDGRAGHAVSLRVHDDPQPEGGKVRYSSLRDPALLAALAAERGIR